MTGRKEVHINKCNEQKVKEVVKKEKSFSGWVNKQLQKYGCK